MKKFEILKVMKQGQSKVSRGEALLNRWADNPRLELTKPGKEWLIAVLDPFHDTPIKDPQGWPDVESSNSVVRVVKQSIEISATSGGGSAPVGNWDCHLALFPWLNGVKFDKSTSRKNNTMIINSNADPSAEVGGLMIMRADAGANVDFLPNLSTSGYRLGSLTLPQDYTQGIGRLVGIGFEVTDTTADIYKQGSCIVYKNPESQRDPLTWTVVDSYPSNPSIGLITGTPVRLPPRNTAEAMLLPGSRQWAARDGCYCVGTFHSNENPPFAVDYNVPILYGTIEDDLTGEINSSQLYIPESTDYVSVTKGSVTYAYSCTTGFHLHPIHMSGAIFSGLNEKSTLRVTMNCYYESFPSLAETGILVLAKPSTEFDPMALSIYSHAISNMPVGVKVDENDSGDWFWDVVSKAGAFLSPMLKAMPTPLAVPAGMIADWAAAQAPKPAAGPPPPLPPRPQAPPIPPRVSSAPKKKKQKKPKK